MLKLPLVSRRVLVTVLALGSVALLPQFVRAQTTVAPSATAAASKQVDEARKVLIAAHAAQKAARGKIEARFKNDPNWAKAQQALDKAKADLAAAQRPALDAAHAKDEYKTASKAKIAAQTRYDALNKEPGGGNADELAKVGDDLAKYTTIMSQIDRETLESDPKVMEAKTHLHDAQTQMDAMQLQVDSAARGDPECQKAAQAVTAAETQVAAAQKSLQAARQAAAQAAADASKARAAAAAQPKPR